MEKELGMSSHPMSNGKPHDVPRDAQESILFKVNHKVRGRKREIKEDHNLAKTAGSYCYHFSRTNNHFLAPSLLCGQFFYNV